jgi:isoleucyl-tRNA synthetase
MINSPVVKG